jgi:hypothetical protein
MRSSVATRDRIGPTQPRPFWAAGTPFKPQNQSACYDTSADRATITFGSGRDPRLSPFVIHFAARQVEPDPAKLAGRYGAEVAALEWKERLVCSGCGNRKVDMVVSGTERR